MRVAVIGAGLGGLCLAQGLRKAGIDVEVFERDPGVRARFQGYRIGLADVGREALLACLPDRLHPLLDAVTGDLHGRRVFHDTQLRQLRELEPMTAIAVDRHVLRHLLLDGIDVRFGKRFTGYRGTRAEFADGTHVDADLIVGADGITSAVRGRLRAGPPAERHRRPVRRRPHHADAGVRVARSRLRHRRQRRRGAAHARLDALPSSAARSRPRVRRRAARHTRLRPLGAAALRRTSR